MRLFLMAILICAPAQTWADGHFAQNTDAMEMTLEGDFQLGGAATRAARIPEVPEVKTEDRPGLRLPFIVPDASDPFMRSEKALGPATVFLNEGLDFGRDALQMGTFLSRGAARAGLSITFLEAESAVSRSSIFLDYALSDRLSVGLAGILDNELSDQEQVRQLGLNAEYSTEGGAFLQGGVAGAEDYDPVIGLSVGLRF